MQLKRQIVATVQRWKQLKQLEKKVSRADELQRKIQHSLQEFSKLKRKQYAIHDGSEIDKLHYYVNDMKVGRLDLMRGRGIMFASQLQMGIFHDDEPPPVTAVENPLPASSMQPVVISSPDTVEEEEKEQTVPSVQVLGMEDSDSSDESDCSTSSHHKKRKKKTHRSKSKTYPARDRRSKLVFDKANGCWIPKWLMLMGNAQSTQDKRILGGAKKSETCLKAHKLESQHEPSKPLQLAGSALAADGASDYGVQSVIFGTMKAMTDEMGMGLTPKELASGVPDVGTLRNWENWELDVAMGCMANVIAQITKDARRMMKKFGKKLQAMLVTDHGNRKGFDHICPAKFIVS